MVIEPLRLTCSFRYGPVSLRFAESCGKCSRRDQQFHDSSVDGYPGPLFSGLPSVFSCPGLSLFHGAVQHGESGFPVAAGRSGVAAYRFFDLIVDVQPFHLFDCLEPMVCRICLGLMCGPAG